MADCSCSWCERYEALPQTGWCRRCISARVSNYERWKRLERPTRLVLAGVYVLGAIWMISEALGSVMRWVSERQGTDTKGE